MTAGTHDTSGAAVEAGVGAAVDAPVDVRLVAPAVAAWAGAATGLVLPPGPGLALAVLLLVVAIVSAGLAGRHRSAARTTSAARPPGAGRRHRPVLLVVAACAVCAAAAGAGAALRLHALQAGPVHDLAAARVTARADLVVTGDPALAASRPGEPALIVVRMRLRGLQAGGRRWRTGLPVLAFATDRGWLSLLPQQRVTAVVRLSPAQPSDDVAALLRIRGRPRPVGRPGAVQRAAGRLRSGLRAAVAGLPAAERGLVPGLVDGDVSGLPPDLVLDFRTTGLTHLTAVSGANCAIVLATVLFTGRRAGLRGRALPGLGAAALLGFLVLARPQPSVLRATVMGLVAVLALAAGRRRLGLPALAAAVLLLVLVDPWLARSFGFVLSVLATAALLVIAPGWTSALQRWLPRPLAAAVAVPAAAQAVCGPVIALLSPRLSIAAVPANMLVAPFVAPTTVLGVLAAVLAPLSSRVAAWLGLAAGLPARVIVVVARILADAPGASMSWPQGPAGGLVLAVVTLLLIAGSRLLLSSGSRSPPDPRERLPGGGATTGAG